jgi:cytoskeletal protein CcmA (bactofilin family)
MRSRLFLALSTALTLLGCQLAFAEDNDAPRLIRLGEDVFLAGEEVRHNAENNGDTLMAGNDVTLTGRVGGDAILAGQNVTVRADVGQDLYAAGAQVYISGTVNGSARVAGGEVEIADQAVIEDGLSIGGGEVEMNGRAGSYVQVAGGEVSINGQVNGNVVVTGGEVKLGPAAVIEGTLTYRGDREPEIASGAQIRGGVQNVPGDREDEHRWPAILGGIALLWMAGWIIAGIVLIALMPRAVSTITTTVRERPGRTLLTGVILLVLVPLAIVILAFTLIGLPLALITLLAYLALLPLGFLAGIASLSDWVLPRLRAGKPVSTGMRIGTFIAAGVILFALTWIPVVGALISFLLLLLGVGGLLVAARAPRSAPVAAA